MKRRSRKPGRVPLSRWAFLLEGKLHSCAVSARLTHSQHDKIQCVNDCVAARSFGGVGTNQKHSDCSDTQEDGSPLVFALHESVSRVTLKYSTTVVQYCVLLVVVRKLPLGAHWFEARIHYRSADLLCQSQASLCAT